MRLPFLVGNEAQNSVISVWLSTSRWSGHKASELWSVVKTHGHGAGSALRSGDDGSGANAASHEMRKGNGKSKATGNLVKLSCASDGNSKGKDNGKPMCGSGLRKMKNFGRRWTLVRI